MDQLICKLKDKHLIRNPRELPCGCSYCLLCIQEEIYTYGKLYCTYCHEEHFVKANELKENDKLKTLLDSKLGAFSELLFETLRDKLNSFKELVVNKTSIMENHFNFIQEEIELRIESIRCDLEQFSNELFNRLDKIKNEILQAFEEADKQSNENLRNCEDFLKQANKTLTNITRNQNEARENLFKCDEFISKIIKAEHEYHRLMRLVTFKARNEDIESSIVGCLVSNLRSDVDIRTLETEMPKFVACESEFTSIGRITLNPYFFCPINNNVMAIIDIHQNEIILMNKYFKKLRTFSSIDGYAIDNPLALCINEEGIVVICDSGHDRLLVVDKYFTKVIQVVGRHGKRDGEFNHPRDIVYFNGIYFVLDFYNQSIQLFDKHFNFINRIRLYDMKQEPNYRILTHQLEGIEDYDIVYDPYKIAVADDSIVLIDYRARLFIYNYEGQLKQIIEQRYINSMCFADGYLFTHGIDGLFACYDAKSFTKLFSRYIPNFQHESNFITYYNKNLIVGFADSFGIIG